MPSPFTPPYVPVSAYSVLLPRIYAAGFGLKDQVFPIVASPGANTPTSGTMYASGIALLQGDVVATVYTEVTIVGTNMTHGYLALYDKAGNRLALSADTPAAFTATGYVSLAMVTPYVVPTSDLYFLTLLATSTGTMPTVQRTTGAGTAVASPAGPLWSWEHAAVTSPPSPATPAANGRAYWLAYA